MIAAVPKPLRGSDAHRDFMVRWIHDAAADLGVPVQFLKRDAFLKWADEREPNAAFRPTRDCIAAYGGALSRNAWSVILGHALAESGEAKEPVRAELGQMREIQRGTNYARKLERLVGDGDYYARRLETALVEAVERCPPVLSTVTQSRVMDLPAIEREIVVHVSDTHWGHIVQSDEVPGGRYDYQIAARRFGLLCQQVAAYKHDEHTALRLVIAGDVVEGSIHSDDRGIDALASQLDAARQMLTSAIDWFRGHFSRIYVETCAGNHDRFSHRDGGRRPMAQKWDGHAVTLYRGVEAIFRNCPEVSFNIPRTPYAMWKSCGHTYFSTHGDGVFQVGTPGKSIHLEKLFSQLWRLESNETIGRADVIMLGHHHWPALSRIPGRQPSAWLAINGSAVGRSAFTQAMNLACSPPVQCFWEVTDRFPVGNYRQVDLWLADEDERYERIVPVPTPIGVPQRAA
jgi:hypothetical protein